MATEELQRVEITESDNITILRFRDQDILKEEDIRQLGEELEQIVEQRPGIRLVVSFSGVRLLASAALGKLITLRRRVERAQGSLTLCELGEEIKENLQITRLDQYFDIYQTEQEAIEALGDK